MNKLSHTAFSIALLAFIVGMAAIFAGNHEAIEWGFTIAMAAGLIGAATSRT